VRTAGQDSVAIALQRLEKRRMRHGFLAASFSEAAKGFPG
jgi:hypothetical protein